MKNRNIALCIVLSIITCGLYGLYWWISVHDAMVQLTPMDNYKTSGVVVLLLSIVTCNIYGWYWAYKMGQKMNMLDNPNGNNNVLFVVLQLFGLMIVNVAIMQDAVNKRVPV